MALCAAGLPILAVAPSETSAVAGAGTISGEIERIFLNTPGDVYAGGQVVVGGQNIIVPRNLLMDLPANRLTLQQLFADAPPACQLTHETGLAKGDVCNTSHTGALITISANRVASGDVIAGDIFLEKGVEAVTGNVTYINYVDGYFRVNGRPNDPTTGVMVRLNDPESRHTLQQGLGCDGGPNCSADPRFTLDPDNYTNAFTSGYPFCIPSTRPRGASPILADLPANPGADPVTGVGDVFCPVTNRGGRVANDSRRMAPLLMGDPVTAEGNFETVNGVQFLSAHSTSISFGLQTSAAADQPDYMFLEEAFIDVAGFQNQRIRALFIGFATNPTPDVLGWSVHYDPEANAVHELPLASTSGCDIVGAGCTGFGTGLFKIRYDDDFVAQPTKPKLSVCAHLNAEPRFGASVCPDADSGADEFAIMSPVPHEVQFRTGKKVADVTGQLKSIDITGAESANGQYLFPFGANLGGINFPEALEFNLDLANQPFAFEGIPWNLDRRLSPGGCQQVPAGGTAPACESTPQPLDPFPFSELDPRGLAGGAIVAGGDVPTSLYNDPVYTSAPLSSAADRILSYIPNAAATRFAGDASVLSFPPVAPASQGITPTPVLSQSGPALLGFDPAQGQIGSTVHLGGLGLGTAVGVDIGTTPALFNVINDARIDVTVPAAADDGLITVHLDGGGAVSSTVVFDVVPNPDAPAITGFSPAAGDVGSTVTIDGSKFTGTTSVLFGTTPASSFSVNGLGTQITATVALETPAGPQPVKVVTLNGSATSAGLFDVTVPPPPPPTAPVVASLSPTSGQAGTAVTLTGSGFTGASGVSFNGAAATFVVINDGQISTSVPATATSGEVTVTNGPDTSTGGPVFTVTVPDPPVATTSFTTLSATQGSGVQLNGSTSTGADSFQWTQTGGLPLVALSGANQAIANFTMPNQFTTLTFRLTVTNTAGSSTKDVTVSAIPGIVTIDAGAQFRTSKNEWRVSGTASFPGANTITVRTGNIPGSGTIIGTAAVDATGAWALSIRGSNVPANSSINAVSPTRGGSAVAGVTIRT